MSRRTRPDQSGRQSTRYGYYVAGLLACCATLNYLDRNILSILAERVRADLHISDAAIGFLYGTAFAVCYAVFGVAMGRLADQWRRARLLGLGLMLWSAMTALTGLAANFIQLAVARLFVGLGEASSAPASQSLIPDLFDKGRRGAAMGIYFAGTAVGSGLALLAGGMVLQFWDQVCGPHCGLAGWRASFLVVGLPGVLLAFLILGVREPVRGGIDGLAVDTPHTRSPWRVFLVELSSVLPPFTLAHMYRLGGARELGRNAAFGAAIAAAAAGMIALVGDWLQWAALGFGVYAVVSLFQSLSIRDRPVFKMTAGSLVFMSLMAGMSTQTAMLNAVSFWAVPYAMRTFHVSPAKAGLMFGLATVIGMGAGTMLGGIFTDRWRRTDLRGAIWIGAICLGIAVPTTLIMYLSQDLRVFFAGYVVISLVSASFAPGVAVQVQELMVPRMRAQAAALFALMVTGFNFAVGPYAAGKVSTLTGSLSTGVISVLVLSPLAAIALWVASRRIEAAETFRVERARAAGEDI
jgi:MFS family permease